MSSPFFEFIPTKKQTTDSNMYRFMKKHKIDSLDELYAAAKSDVSWYWESVSQDIGIVWDKKYDTVLDVSGGVPWPKWFVGGRTNIVKSSIEKFAAKTPNKIAYHFISESGKTSTITYHELNCEVNLLANGLKSIGITKGDVVGIFMPMIKEAIIAILACAKIGAIQTVIFSGYSSDSLRVRLQDCNAKALFVSDGLVRKGKKISQKKLILDAVANNTATPINTIIVTTYTKIDTYHPKDFNDIISYNNLISNQSDSCESESMDTNDPLFILYTSGTTGKPKGVIHNHGGFSVFAGYQASYLIDFTPDDTLFWPADIGWITGLVWNVYGMTLIGGSAILYDGALDYPDLSRIWKTLDEYNATIFGISPTAVRLYKQNDIEPRSLANLDKIKNIPTTGEPLDADSWNWLYDKVGNKKIPIMNLSGGTELGGAVLSVLPGMKLKPSTVGMPCPGIDLDIYDENENSVRLKKGYLVIKSPWPAMTCGLLNDDSRYIKTYWSKFNDVWFHGDYVLCDKDGLWYMLGRVDDLINVSGHQLSTVEIEHKVILHHKVLDAASIAIPDDITGQAIIVFLVPKNQYKNQDLTKEITSFISSKIGKIAKPKHVFQVSDLPKTRTGKIMRRTLRAKLLGLPLGDTTSLENPDTLQSIPTLG